MSDVFENDVLLDLISGSYYIHGSIVNRFDIHYENDELHIDVYFTSIKEEKLKIRFLDIISYQFNYNDLYNFYKVESFKFFKAEQDYYLSLDPFDATEEISDDDQDVILCKKIQGKLL